MKKVKVKTKKEKGTQLEAWVLEQLKPIDKYARLSRASGASNDIGDVVASAFFIECKNWNRECVTLSMKVWNHLINQLPINTPKVPIYVYQNKNGKKFVIMEAEDFFRKVRQE
jgi:hypothetical protein